ncbi:hypothetical protein QBC45DRAFT_172148 [Copromyces sp. CBS 386.78]|nr:hypothetical protein QBC45DRAFT_172148 [Copromyces sp. CBS 386.78]
MLWWRCLLLLIFDLLRPRQKERSRLRISNPRTAQPYLPTGNGVVSRCAKSRIWRVRQCLFDSFYEKLKSDIVRWTSWIRVSYGWVYRIQPYIPRQVPIDWYIRPFQTGISPTNSNSFRVYQTHGMEATIAQLVTIARLSSRTFPLGAANENSSLRRFQTVVRTMSRNCRRPVSILLLVPLCDWTSTNLFSSQNIDCPQSKQLTAQLRSLQSPGIHVALDRLDRTLFALGCWDCAPLSPTGIPLSFGSASKGAPCP